MMSIEIAAKLSADPVPVLDDQGRQIGTATVDEEGVVTATITDEIAAGRLRDRPSAFSMGWVVKADRAEPRVLVALSEVHP